MMVGLIWLLCTTAAAETTVRVLLNEDRQPLQLESLSPLSIESSQDHLFLAQPRTLVTLLREGRAWTVRWQQKGEPQEQRMAGEKLSLKTLDLRWKGYKIDFPLEIVQRKKNYLLIGQISIETYLRGVVAHEMPSSWPLEALKAQVVASRTYALWKAQSQKNADYDLKPSVLDQVFRLNKAGESTSLAPAVEKALSATRDTYLVNRKNRVVQAYFHSDCGGSTNSAEEVWGLNPEGEGSVRDVACEKRDSGWQSQWTAERIKARLLREIVLPLDLQLEDVVIRKQLESQRAEWVDLIFSKGIFKRVRGEDVRRLLGYDKIKSTRFSVARVGNSFVFQGRGFGHGVGLCQHGARALASSGVDHQAILVRYYPGTLLKNSSPSDTPRAAVSASRF